MSEKEYAATLVKTIQYKGVKRLEEAPKYLKSALSGSDCKECKMNCDVTPGDQHETKLGMLEFNTKFEQLTL